jgi:hypothetical protein
MKNSAFVVRSHIRNVVLCSLLTFGLAACGADAGSSSSGTASAASDPIPSLVAPSVGVIDRTGIPSVVGTTGTAANAMPPTENTDGSVLTNLAGYTVYYGTSASNLTQSVKITNPGLTACTLSNLPSGTWYFAVTSYSSTGIESSRSGVVSTTI